ncbi:MAG: histidinol-phosphate transaminase [Oscillospiraceae bacterium]
MPYSLNKKLVNLKPYDPIQGNYKIRLDANESFFNVNEILSEKVLTEIAKINLNRYPDPYAEELVKAFSDFYEIERDLITAGNGSDEIISIITSCFLEKGDTILTLSNDFSMYAFYGNLYELNVKCLEKNTDLTVDVDKLIAYCNENSVKAVIFSNPCNPTSLGICREDVLKLIQNVSSLVIVDEAYMDFWGSDFCGEESVIKNTGDYDNLIVLKTCSKAIGLAAARIGFAVSSKKNTIALKAAKSPYNTDSISQIVGKVVLSEKKILQNMRNEIIFQRDELYKGIIKLSQQFEQIEVVYNTVTNFVFIKTSFADAIFNSLLKKSIAIRKMGNYLRITAGNKAENKELLKSLEEILNNF